MRSQEALKSVMLLAVAVIAIGGGLVYWQYSARSSAEQRVQAIEAEMPNEQEIQNDLQESQMQLAEYRTQLEHLEKSVPSIAYVPTLLRELEIMGKENDIVVTGVRPVPVSLSTDDPEEKPYQELEIDITGQGTYAAVLNMIGAIQVFPKVMALKTVNLAPRQGAQTRTKELDVTIRVKAYVFKQTIDDPMSAKPAPAGEFTDQESLEEGEPADAEAHSTEDEPTEEGEL